MSFERNADRIDLDQVQRTSDERDRNEKRIKDGSEPCLLCGKGTSDDRFVHMSTDGFLFPVSATLSEENDQGWFPVGPECAKKLPTTFVAKEPV